MTPDEAVNILVDEAICRAMQLTIDAGLIETYVDASSPTSPRQRSAPA